MSPAPQPTPEQERALQEYADEVGRCWKAALHTAWCIGSDEDKPLLRQVRNQLGPKWLYSAWNKIKPRRK